jgi:methylmalonyl-CoA mutase N-terminal domain/subunit
MIALRTQQIMANEVGICNVADPLGGSYYVEALTNQLEKEILLDMEEVVKKGGMVASLENGWILAKITEMAYKYHREVEGKKRIIVGQNEYNNHGGEDKFRLPIHQTSGLSAKTQIENLKNFKSSRDIEKLRNALENLYRKAEKKDENLMYPMIEAAAAYATVGEIMGIIRTAYGFHYDPFGELECSLNY